MKKDLMNTANSILEISVLSTENSTSRKRYFEKSISNQTAHTLFLDERNVLFLQLENKSDKLLIFEFGMKIKLSFETLLSREEVGSITLENEHWSYSVEKGKEDEKSGKTFYSFVMTPEKEFVLGAGETFSFKLFVYPVGNPTFSHLSVQFEKLKKLEKSERKLLSSINDHEFLLRLRTYRINERLELLSGIVGDDILYYAADVNVENEFAVYLINPGLNLCFPDSGSHLRIQWGNAFTSSIISLGLDRKDSGDLKQWDYPLPKTWKERETILLKFKCQLKFSTDFITSLKIEYIGIPDYNDGAIYIPLKVMKQKQIGSEAVSIKVDKDVIYIG